MNGLFYRGGQKLPYLLFPSNHYLAPVKYIIILKHVKSFKNLGTQNIFTYQLLISYCATLISKFLAIQLRWLIADE